MESDDDFEFDDLEVDIGKSVDDFDEKRPTMKFSAADFEDHKSTISQSSSTLSLPVCRICQLPSMEPNNHLISPCRCLGSIRYVHNNCLLVSQFEKLIYNFLLKLDLQWLGCVS
jgi:hypothetical protein